MNTKPLLYSIALLLFACKAKVVPVTGQKKMPVDQNLEVVIKYALSNEIDLTKQLYTVFFAGRPPVDIRFKLSPSEKQQIIDKYYALSLYELNKVDQRTGTIHFEDECIVMPKFYTYLTCKRGGITQNIQTDEDCDEYKTSGENDTAERVKIFIQFVNNIVRNKPEIKNAPYSNIIYL